MKYKKNKSSTKSNTSSRGFTVLFASLIGALVLSIGLAILNITLKQDILSSAGRKTQQSFYAADSGVECALYLDRGSSDPDCKLGLFGTPSTTAASGVTICGVESTSYSPQPELFQCFGKSVTIVRGTKDSYDRVIDQISIDSDPSTELSGRNVDMDGNVIHNSDTCFIVDVTKTLVNQSTNEIATKFESRGYNTCNTNSPSRFERAIRVLNN